VGPALLQVAHAVGATVTGTSRSPWKLERAAALGLDRAVHVEGEFAPDATLTDWANVIADLVGGPYLAGNLRAAAPRGRLVQIGLTAGRTAQVDLGLLLRKRLTLLGTVLRSRSAAEKTAAVRGFAAWAAPHLAAGTLRPVLDRAFPAEDAAAAHRYVEENRNFGSVVLTWG
jgi:NADPH:quinone reductase-like Zn-dependent oxidoreductase